MPELTGTTFQEAAEQLNGLGLIPVHLDSIYNRTGRPFEVIDQVPPAEAKIKAGRRVYLTTYRSTPPYERLGIEEGQDPGIARIILENRGFEVEEALEPNVALVGRVIRMEDAKGRALSADSRRPKGTKVVLVSGTTTRELVGVPDLKGMTLDEARTALVEAKLSVGLVEYAESVEDASDSTRAKVLEQHLSPTLERIVPAGTELDLYLGLRWDRGRTE
jgi:beta-lactam-binding protein with PASTA domain